MSDTKVYKPYIRALLGTASHFSDLYAWQLLGEMTAAAEKEAQDSFDDDEAGFGQPRAGALPTNPQPDTPTSESLAICEFQIPESLAIWDSRREQAVVAGHLRNGDLKKIGCKRMCCTFCSKSRPSKSMLKGLVT